VTFGTASTVRAVALAAAALAAPGCASQAIGVYQRWLGPQWAFHCDFEPSCSSYGKQAVESYGAAAGALMTADRLMRDHDLSREHYPHDERGHPLDPPQANPVFAPRGGGGPSDDALAAMQAQEQAEVARAPLGTDFDEAAQLRFADQLFAAGDWDRARIEYARLLHHRPRTQHATSCRERVAICLARVGRRREALAEAERVAEAAESGRTRALVLREIGRPADALEAAQADPSVGPLLAGMLALEAGRAQAARFHFQRLDGELREELLARAGELEVLPSRSRWLAGSLSAVLPGAGQLYAGRPEDGAVAFLTNAILIGGTAAAAHNDEDATAVALGFVALGFYAGNVYGAVNAAAGHDRDQARSLAARARGRLRQSGLLLAPTGTARALYFDL
jgi:putative component of membrane protein insertase Oxa1/YidC/SpoIIIJ protein YidD